MKFLADENFPLPSIHLLAEAGHDIIAVIEDSSGAADIAVLERASREARILLTFDRDYGQLLYQQGAATPAGLVYYRFVPSSPEEPAQYLLSSLEQIELSLHNMLTVAERDRVRQRPLPGTN